jgi:hypothetical protein
VKKAAGGKQTKRKRAQTPKVTTQRITRSQSRSRAGSKKKTAPKTANGGDSESEGDRGSINTPEGSEADTDDEEQPKKKR